GGRHQLRRYDGAGGAVSRRPEAAVRGRLRGGRHNPRGGPRRRWFRGGPARDGGHSLRRLRRAGRGQGGGCDPAAGRAELRAGRRDPGELPDGVAGCDPVRDAPGRRARADPCRGGRLVAFGASSVMSGERRNLLTAGRAALRMPRFNLIKQMSASKAVIGLNMLTLWDHIGTVEPWLTPLREMLDDGTVNPVVAEALPFDRAPDAHPFIAERRNGGNGVLTP